MPTPLWTPSLNSAQAHLGLLIKPQAESREASDLEGQGIQHHWGRAGGSFSTVDHLSLAEANTEQAMIPLAQSHLLGV